MACSYSLQNTNILDQSKLKAFTDDKIDVAQNLKIIHWRVENIVGEKGGNAGYQQKSHSLGVVKSLDCLVKG